MMPQSLGVIGGKPNSAHYFIGYVGEWWVPSKGPVARGPGRGRGLRGGPSPTPTGSLTQCQHAPPRAQVPRTPAFPTSPSPHCAPRPGSPAGRAVVWQARRGAPAPLF